MQFDPSSRNLTLSDEDLTDPRVQKGWDLAVEDGVALTEVTRHGQLLQVREVPKALAEAYFPAFLINLSVKLGQQTAQGDTENVWGGWEPSLGDDEDEW